MFGTFIQCEIQFEVKFGRQNLKTFLSLILGPKSVKIRIFSDKPTRHQRS